MNRGRKPELTRKLAEALAENERLRRDNKALEQFRRFYIIGEIRVRRALRGVQRDNKPGRAADLD
jgi:hypothetical protein